MFSGQSITVRLEDKDGELRPVDHLMPMVRFRLEEVDRLKY